MQPCTASERGSEAVPCFTMPPRRGRRRGETRRGVPLTLPSARERGRKKEGGRQGRGRRGGDEGEGTRGRGRSTPPPPLQPRRRGAAVLTASRFSQSLSLCRVRRRERLAQRSEAECRGRLESAIRVPTSPWILFFQVNTPSVKKRNFGKPVVSDCEVEWLCVVLRCSAAAGTSPMQKRSCVLTHLKEDTLRYVPCVTLRCV